MDMNGRIRQRTVSDPLLYYLSDIAKAHYLRTLILRKKNNNRLVLLVPSPCWAAPLFERGICFPPNQPTAVESRAEPLCPILCVWINPQGGFLFPIRETSV